MKTYETKIKGCFILEPRVFSDDRGTFFESFNKKAFAKETGIDIEFVQDNQSVSKKNVVRGLHFQVGEYAQTKLVRVVKGRIFDVCVDLRPESETFKNYVALELSAENHKQLYIPKGCAHGFLVLEDNSIVNYKCDQFYNKESERGIAFNDVELDINWTIDTRDAILSEKDRQLPSLKHYLNEH